jgi:uncharacterized membrane protein YczE
MIALMRRTTRGFVPVRLAMEASMFLVALLLHGPLGLGTVVYGLGVGPAIHVLLHRLPRRFTEGHPVSPETTL